MERTGVSALCQPSPCFSSGSFLKSLSFLRHSSNVFQCFKHIVLPLLPLALVLLVRGCTLPEDEAGAQDLKLEPRASAACALVLQDARDVVFVRWAAFSQVPRSLAGGEVPKRKARKIRGHADTAKRHGSTGSGNQLLWPAWPGGHPATLLGRSLHAALRWALPRLVGIRIGGSALSGVDRRAGYSSHLHAANDSNLLDLFIHGFLPTSESSRSA